MVTKRRPRGLPSPQRFAREMSTEELIGKGEYRPPSKIQRAIFRELVKRGELKPGIIPLKEIREIRRKKESTSIEKQLRRTPTQELIRHLEYEYPGKYQKAIHEELVRRGKAKPGKWY